MKYPCYPPKPPAKPEGMLYPHIVSCEKRTIPCFQTTLRVNADPCWPTPLRFSSLSPAFSQPTLALSGEMDACGHLPVVVNLPLCLTLSDACGRMHALHTCIDIPTWLSRACHWRQSLITIPTVQLLQCAPACGCFEVTLHITLEFCLLQFGCAPACPNLPLYPPPIHC